MNEAVSWGYCLICFIEIGCLLMCAEFRLELL